MRARRGPRLAPAPVRQRLAAYAIDLACVLGPAVLAWVLLRGIALAVVVALEVVIALVLTSARSGWTPGKGAVGLRTAQRDRPYAPGLARAGVRGAILTGAHVLVLGPLALLVLRRPTGEFWHDAVARTRVVALRIDPALAPASQAETAATPGPVPAPPAAVTPSGAVPAAAVTPSGPDPVLPSPAAPHEDTVTSDDSLSLAAYRRLRTPGEPLALELRVHGGSTYPVTSSAVLGRRPDPAGGDVVVVLPDPAREVSRTHAFVRVAEGGVWLQDAGSTNGCLVRESDGTVVRVAPNEVARLTPGAVIEIGRVLVDVDVVRGTTS